MSSRTETPTSTESTTNTSSKILHTLLEETSTLTMISSSPGSSEKSLPTNHTNTTYSVTLPSSNMTTMKVPQNDDHSGLHISKGIALAIFFITLSLIIIGCAFLYYLKKKRNFSCKRCDCKICLPKRRRRGSTSSRGPLTQDDATFVHITDSFPRQERELFSISDQDGGDDGRQNSRQRRGTEDDYFYDEIFEKSAFVDETTNRANTHLTVEENLSELTIPDLVFKKPTTRI